MINSSSPPSPTSSSIAQPAPEQNITSDSQQTNTLKHQVFDLDRRLFKKRKITKSISSEKKVEHSFSDDCLQKDSTKRVGEFIKNTYRTYRNLIRNLPCCGFFEVTKFSILMMVLASKCYKYSFTKTIISVGSSTGFIEKCFDLMHDGVVKCYDKKPLNKADCFMPVEQAEFPKDIDKCLPDDCTDCTLFAGYPQGYLGSVLDEFIKRGGTRFCTTVDSDLFNPIHTSYEPDPKVLEKGIDYLKSLSLNIGGGECFSIYLGNSYGAKKDSTEGVISCFQFYNWPLDFKLSMLRHMFHDYDDIPVIINDT